MPTGSRETEGDSEREARLYEVIEGYLEAVDAGRRPNRDELVRRHPDLAAELDAYLEGQEELDRLAADLPPGVTGAEPSPPPDAPGDYEILEEIARGGMGVVFKARQRSLQRIVALKMILAGRLASPDEVLRFRREAEAAAGLDHPGIVPIYEVGEHEGQHFYAMKLIEGGSLADHGKRYLADSRAAARILEAVARTVHYAHLKGVLHRDLKPANILMDGGGTPYIADFGLARASGTDPGMTQSSAIVGTPKYMAPEQASGKKGRLTPATDVYSLGAILFELLAGRPPFQKDSSVETLRAVLEEEVPSLHDFNTKVPRDLETVCLKCLEKDPRRRYESAGALADDLQRFLAGLPVDARRVTILGRAWRWCLRKPALASLSAAVASLLIVIAVGSLVAARGLRERLRDAYLARAAAGRLSGSAGQRFESLKALADAARIRPALELRNEAIRCMLLPDLELLNHREVKLGGQSALAVELDPLLERYAASEASGVIHVRRLEDDREELVLPGPGVEAQQIFFAPGGRYIGAYHSRSTTTWWLQLWDLSQPLSPILKERRSAFDFHPAGREVVLGRADGSIAVFDLTSRTEVRSIPAAIHDLRSIDWVRVRPTGDAVAVCGRPRSERVDLVDLSDGRVIRSFLHPASVVSITWHPDGALLGVCCAPRDARVWDAETGAERLVIKAQGPMTDIAFSTTADLIASTGWDAALRLWDLQTGRQHLTASGTYRVRFHPDGSLLGSINTDSRLWVWRVADGGELRSLSSPPPQPVREGEPEDRSYALEFSSDGRWLAAPGLEGVAIWDLRARRRVAYLARGLARSAFFEEDGERSPTGLITWEQDGLHRWPLSREGGSAAEASLTVGPSNYLGIKPGARFGPAALDRGRKTLALVSDYDRKEVLILDARTRETVASVRGQTGVFNIALSPDGTWLAAGAWRGTGVRIWDARNGAHALDLPVSGNSRVAFSPDGERLITAASGEYRSWSVGTWIAGWSAPRENPGGLPGRAAFSRDGKLLAVQHSATDLKLLEPSTGVELATLASPDPKPMECLEFSPSGAVLAAGSVASIRLWDVERIRRQLSSMGLDW